MEKQIKIALAGNPNSGKTTLFNALTGSNQFVGNWPGVTVEKKEGKLKKHDDVVIMDLPGIYSLSPYTLEEVVSRNYLITERPDAILNIVDGTNLERNLYLTTQLTELGIPVVVAINMMDVVKKNGDQINIKELSRQLGCPVLEISALKGTGIMEAAEAAVKAAAGPHTEPQHTFSGPVEHAIAHIEEAVLHDKPAAQQRWYAIKIFERDDKVLEQLSIPADVMKHIEADIKAAEKELDDDAESIVTGARYDAIGDVVGGYQLAHAAYAEGEAALADILGEDKPYGTMPVPVCTYTLPVLASVGLTTEAAEAAGYEPVLGTFDYGANGMALAEGAVGRVFVVADKNTTKTLGVSIVGENSAEMRQRIHLLTGDNDTGYVCTFPVRDGAGGGAGGLWALRPYRVTARRAEAA